MEIYILLLQIISNDFLIRTYSFWTWRNNWCNESVD